MNIKEIRKDVYSVGVVDWDRRLFDELIPLPHGTSYNAYLVIGSEKTALIDTVYPPKGEELLENLQKAKIKGIDYIISNHAEQDHSGTIPDLLRIYPQAKVVTNPKCMEMLKDLLLIPEEKFLSVNDNESISLGNKTLQFFLTPWVHWPETMVTYLKEEKILFSCDLFGSHLATDDLFAIEEHRVYEAAKRYYAEIMMPFRPAVRRNIEKITSLPIEIIAPSHGPLYHKPQFILDAYSDWTSDEVKNEVVVPFISMYGSTRKMVNYILDCLMQRGIKVKPFNLTQTDIGEFAISLVDAATCIMASPTVLAGPHPSLASAVYLLNILRPKLKFISFVGSYGWGGKTVEFIKGLLTGLKAEFIEPVMVKGHPGKEDFRGIEKLAERIYEKHREAGIVK